MRVPTRSHPTTGQWSSTLTASQTRWCEWTRLRVKREPALATENSAILPGNSALLPPNPPLQQTKPRNIM